MENTKYLDLLERKLDEDQMAACVAEGNVVIAAGAGSGKTQVLATRFAYLVMTKGIQCDRILTLTFTKKAAAEMYERIFKTLSFFACNPEVSEIERNRAKDAVSNFGKVHIQTLDSYSASILRQVASRYGIRPDFSQGSGEEKTIAENLALPFVLSKRNDDAIKYFMDAKNAGDLQKVSEALVSEVSSATLADGSDFFDKQLEEEIKKHKRDFEILKEKGEEVDEEAFENHVASERVKNKLKAEFLEKINEKKRLSGVLGFSDVNALVLKAIRENDDLRLQEQSAYDKIMIDEFQDNNDDNRKLLFLISGKEGATVESCEDGSGIVDGKLFFVGDDKQSIYKFRGADVSVFKALSTYLKNEPKNMNINYRSTGELIDSFNSIFGGFTTDFAGGKELLLENEIEKKEMTIFPQEAGENENFQATFGYKTIAEKNLVLEAKKNEIDRLKEKLEKEVSGKRAGHFCMYASYTAFTNDNRPDELEKMISPFRAILKSQGKKSDEKEAFNFAFKKPDDQKAIFIAREIRRRIDESKVIVEKLKTSDDYKKIKAADPDYELKPLTYRDFAVLDRSRTNRSNFVKYFQVYGIPFNLDQISGVFENTVVNDIYNFLRLCIYPSDTLALSVYLTSPFSSLSVGAVENILAFGFSLDSVEFDEETKNPIVPVCSFFNATEQKLFENATRNYFEIKKRSESSSIAETISYLWNEMGYCYEVLWDEKKLMLSENYDFLFEYARKCDLEGKNLSFFIDRLDNLRNRFNGKSDSSDDISALEYPKEGADEVQVMTIHKSKGLQFKICFVCGCDGNAKGSEGEGDETEKTSSEKETLEDAAEFKRIIYVALTRAEKEFYVVGSWWNGNKNSKKISAILTAVAQNYYPGCEFYGWGERRDEKDAPFDYVSIRPVDFKEIEKDERKGNGSSVLQKDDKNEYIRFFDGLENKFNDKFNDEKLRIVSVNDEDRIDENIRISPSKLERGSEIYGRVEPITPSESEVLTPELDLILEKATEKGFDATHFGTLAHAYLEAKVSGIEKYFPSPKLFRKLWNYEKRDEENEKNEIISKLMAVCQKMAENFSKSDFYQEAKNAKKLQCEYKFIALVDKLIVNGVMDLVYQKSDGKIVIVDYKTNKEMIPEEYEGQLSIYKKAAAEIFEVSESEIECYLYYLRYGRSVKVCA